MAKLPYMKWYPSDFDGDEDVKLMTDEEVGFYVRCLNHAWLHRGLPADEQLLAKMFHKSLDELRRLWQTVGRKFYADPETGRFVNKRQEEDRGVADKKSEKAAASVRTRYERRYERNTNESLRAYDSDSVSESASEEKKSEPQKAAENCERTASPVEPLPQLKPSEIGIEGWDELVEVAAKAQMSMNPDPASDLCQKYWKRLDFQGRRQRIQGIQERIRCGQYDDPQYVPSLENYVKHKWRESLRPRARPGPQLVDASRKPDGRVEKSRTAAEIREAC